ncbi:MAG: glucosidase [Desulfofustis sp.]|nr:glucosidase [Desulfofustis sp.]
MQRTCCPDSASLAQTIEGRRLLQQESGEKNWYRWGPYLSERQWGTVREDYSGDGEPWDYLVHDDARCKTYRWGEDGLAGFSDVEQKLCLGLALWNGKDPILKERLFGLTNAQGNHGEDVKEYYYFLDALPSHAYCKMLYKYPQEAFPYAELEEHNSRRKAEEDEYELIDTGLFDDNRYFDILVEYGKGDIDDILLKVSATNRAAVAHPLTVIVQLWYRNVWSFSSGVPRPALKLQDGAVHCDHPDFSDLSMVGDQAEFLFCDNDTAAPDVPYPKESFHLAVVESRAESLNPAMTGTKAGLKFEAMVEAKETVTFRARLGRNKTLEDFEQVMNQRRDEADEFYHQLQCRIADPEKRLIQRQALAGMIWSKQFYYYDVDRWLEGDLIPPPSSRQGGRNRDWRHMRNRDVISMPDTWEYPWYATWDLAFHCLPLALIDSYFAKQQLLLFTRENYLHPNGQLPAYEWNFCDVNPPVHAWGCWRVFQIDRAQRGGDGDLAFLEQVFHKLLLNFTWWVNRKDVEELNVFQGGFLGLDNIGVFDRSKPLPTGGHINQADGTAWMAMYSLNMMRIALELSLHNPVYEEMAIKFFRHFLNIAKAMTNMAGCGIGLWDEDDKFYYDELSLPDQHGEMQRIALKVRSLVGIIPLFAVETIEPETLSRLPRFGQALNEIFDKEPELAGLVSHWHEPGRGDRRLLSLLRGHRMKRLLHRMLDPGEFLSEYGIRSLSKTHETNPYVFEMAGQRYEIKYVPGESTNRMFGGNSNWRGPIWLPINFLIIESLQKFHHYYGDDFKIEYPTGSGQYSTILEVAEHLSKRLVRLFQLDEFGQRPIYHHCERMQQDPEFRDHLLFYEYFHGDNGRGVGASHQTGWTALVAKLLYPRRPLRN